MVHSDSLAQGLTYCRCVDLRVPWLVQVPKIGKGESGSTVQADSKWIPRGPHQPPTPGSLLTSDGWIDDGPLAAVLNFDSHFVALVLIRNQRRNVRFNAARTEANDHDGRCKATKRCTSVNCSGQCGGPEDQKTNPIDTGEDENRLVPAEILIGDDGTENGSDCRNWLAASVRLE